MPEPQTRPWYFRKRAWAAAGLWLAFAYVAGVGPASYAVNRGWISIEVYWPAYTPVRKAAAWSDPEGVGPVNAYVRWWAARGLRHAASD